MIASQQLEHGLQMYKQGEKMSILGRWLIGDAINHLLVGSTYGNKDMIQIEGRCGLGIKVLYACRALASKYPNREAFIAMLDDMAKKSEKMEWGSLRTKLLGNPSRNPSTISIVASDQRNHFIEQAEYSLKGLDEYIENTTLDTDGKTEIHEALTSLRLAIDNIQGSVEQVSTDVELSHYGGGITLRPNPVPYRKWLLKAAGMCVKCADPPVFVIGKEILVAVCGKHKDMDEAEYNTATSRWMTNIIIMAWRLTQEGANNDS